MKKNTLLILTIALFAILLLAPMVHAYETENYTITLPESLKSVDGNAFFEDEDGAYLVIGSDGEKIDLTEDEFYSDVMLEEMKSNIGDLEGYLRDLFGFTDEIEVISSSNNCTISEFTKNKYKCLKLSFTFELKETATGETGKIIMDYYFTIQNDLLWQVSAIYEEGINSANTAIDTLTFKTPVAEEPAQEEPAKEEPVAEEPAVEEPKEDTTKATGKLPQTSVIVTFDIIAISLIVLCGTLLVVNNKRK